MKFSLGIEDGFNSMNQFLFYHFLHHRNCRALPLVFYPSQTIEGAFPLLIPKFRLNKSIID